MGLAQKLGAGLSNAYVAESWLVQLAAVKGPLTNPAAKVAASECMELERTIGLANWQAPLGALAGPWRTLLGRKPRWICPRADLAEDHPRKQPGLTQSQDGN